MSIVARLASDKMRSCSPESPPDGGGFIDRRLAGRRPWRYSWSTAGPVWRTAVAPVRARAGASGMSPGTLCH